MEKIPGQESGESKIVVPEIQEKISEAEKDINEIEEILKEHLPHLKEGIELLENDLDYLEHMQNSNDTADFLNEMAEEEGFEKRTNKKYSVEEIEKIKNDIENMRNDIKEINNSMTGFDLLKVRVQENVDDFKDIEKRFNNILLHIKSSQFN